MSEDTSVVWKKIYQVVSGNNPLVTTKVKNSVFRLCSQELINVLLPYESYTKDSFDQWCETVKKFSIYKDDELALFIHRMSKELDLNVNILWDVICNYLTFEYYGKIEELKLIIIYETNMKILIDHVWYFYSAERMFLLKTLQCLFEKPNEAKILFDQYDSLLKNIDIFLLWKNLLKTFNHLIGEIDLSKVEKVSRETLQKWVNRNNREQVMVLHLMIHVANLIKLNGHELIDILKLFLKHGFGKNNISIDETLSKPKDTSDIKHLQIGVVLTIVNRYWQNPKLCENLPNLDDDLKQYEAELDDGVILFIWMVFKSTLSNDCLDYCSMIFEKLIQKNIFRTFSVFLTADFFKNTKVAIILLENTKALFNELMKICDDYKFIYEQDGMVEILCELFRQPKLGAFEGFGKFFEISYSMFPYDLSKFLSLAEALMCSDTYYSKVLKLLHNCKTLCTEQLWPYDSSESLYLAKDIKLFTGTDKFTIPAGTVAEKFKCYGEDYVRYQINYDFFEIIEQYIRSVTVCVFNKGECKNSLLTNFLRAIKFLNFLVRHYNEDKFAKDSVINPLLTIKPLLTRLDCIPTYYSKGGFRNFDVFYIFFEIKCSTFINLNGSFDDVFPLFIRKSLFPYLDDYAKDKDLDLRMLNSRFGDSILYQFLKEEEYRKNHKLLLQYIELVLFILKREKLYTEILFSGVIYVLNAVFFTHHQWNYDEAGPLQQTQILNLCLQIFIQILQQDPDELPSNGPAKKLYNLLYDSLFENDCIIDNLCKLFVKDKFHLQNIMQQELNWTAGESLIVIKTINLQLTLFLLIFKCKEKVCNKETSAIDTKTHILAKSVCGYLLNPYKRSLAIIAGKFLEILSRNETIPLISSLGLDYEQIQKLFLERLRDPMEDDNVKLCILILIGTCIKHQTGMTAAFFNIQSSKKWYETDRKKYDIKEETIADFMIDYLNNIIQSVDYLKSPLQIGVLRVMVNLWECNKQHLVNEVTSLPEFWSLMFDPLYKPFEQSPTVYSYILKIMTIQLQRKHEEKFIESFEKFLYDDKQLKLFKEYLSGLFSVKNINKVELEEKVLLLESWCELLVAIEKYPGVKPFANRDSRCSYIDLCFDCIQYEIVHSHILNSWLSFILIIIDMLGLKADEFNQSQAINFARIMKNYYPNMTLADKRLALTIVLKINNELKDYYEQHPNIDFINIIGDLFDIEYNFIRDKALNLKDNQDVELLSPLALHVAIANRILTLRNCKQFDLWFVNRKFLNKMIECTCHFLTCQNTFTLGRLTLYNLILYVQSDLALDFLKVNVLEFYDQIEPAIYALIQKPKNKILQNYMIDLKDAWITFTLLISFTRSFLKQFRKNAIDICFTFLTLFEHVVNQVVNLAENSVDCKALELLVQLLMLYEELLINWKPEWNRKSNNSFTSMIDNVKQIINSCIFLCLRPKRIRFYFLDVYYRLLPVDDSKSVNDLMLIVMNRLISILGLGFSCLYQLNSNLIDLFDCTLEPDKSFLILIENEFNAPQLELETDSNDLTYGNLLTFAHFLCRTISQLSRETEFVIDEEKYKYSVGFLEGQDPNEFMPDEKLSTILRYVYEHPGFVDPWLKNLNYYNVQRTLENIMLLIAQQTYLMIKSLPIAQVQFYKANLSSELQFFNDYVKKQTSEALESLNISNTSTSKLSNYSTLDMDMIKRYLLSTWEFKKQNDLVDKNFLLIMYYWFNNICQVQ